MIVLCVKSETMKKYIISIFIYLHLAIGISAFGTYFLTVNTMRKLSGRPLWYKGIYYFGRYWLWICGIKLQIIGHMPTNEPHVVIMNHHTVLDIPLSAVALNGEPCTALAAKKLSQWPFIGSAFKMFGTVFLERDYHKDQSALQSIGDTLKDEELNLIVFPEGTRGLRAAMERFKKGAFHIAVQNALPIQPVFLINSFDAKPKNRWWFKPRTITIVYGEPIPTSGVTNETFNRFFIEVENTYTRMYNALCEQYA